MSQEIKYSLEKLIIGSFSSANRVQKKNATQNSSLPVLTEGVMLTLSTLSVSKPYSALRFLTSRVKGISALEPMLKLAILLRLSTMQRFIY